MPHCRTSVSCTSDCVCGCKVCSPEKTAKGKRFQISHEAQARAVQRLESALERRLKQKGRGTFASTHEILGIVTEEYDEFVDAVRANDRKMTMKELEDIAVACVFAFACDEEGGLEW